MERITLIRTEDNTIWVTSDADGIGIEFAINELQNENRQMMAALAKFLGYEPSSILCFDEED